MALSFRRETAETAPEALVFSEGFSAAPKLIEELDAQFGEDQWLEVSGEEAERILSIANPEDSFVIVTLDSDDPEVVEAVARRIRLARQCNLLVLLVVGEVSSRTMHRIMREGVAEFAPYPEPRGALVDAIDRLRLARSSGALPAVTASGAPRRLGKVVAFYGVAGGVGASTMAVNFAWELALATRREGRRVALLDFNFQYGSVATFLDVPRREAVYELLSEAANLDQTGLTQALSTYKERLHVLTAPRDALPLDIVSPSDVDAIIGLAREAFDYVVIDMPQDVNALVVGQRRDELADLAAIHGLDHFGLLFQVEIPEDLRPLCFVGVAQHGPNFSDVEPLHELGSSRGMQCRAELAQLGLVFLGQHFAKFRQK